MNRENVIGKNASILEKRLLGNDRDDTLVRRRNLRKIENFSSDSGVDVVDVN